MNLQVGRLKRWQKTSRLWRRVGNLHWARALNDHGVQPEAVRRGAGGELEVGALGVSLRRGVHEFVLEGYGCAIDLVRAGARFEVTGEGEMRVRTGGVMVGVRNKEDLFILRELYVAGSYELAVRGDLLVLDVGMNVGHASLYFAQRYPGAMVVGFEPLRPTFARAEKNFAGNGELAKRIRANPVGLSDADGELEVEYTDDVPGLASLYGLPAERKAYVKARKERIVVRDAAAVMDEVLAAHPERRVVMKVDCEGAEYRVMQRLAGAGKLGRVDVVMMEWHRLAPEHDPRAMRDLLAREGFACVVQDVDAAPAGMLYAVRVGGGAGGEAQDMQRAR
jgi:FkbM family methyltransferase